MLSERKQAQAVNCRSKSASIGIIFREKKNLGSSRKWEAMESHQTSFAWEKKQTKPSFEGLHHNRRRSFKNTDFLCRANRDHFPKSQSCRRQVPRTINLLLFLSVKKLWNVRKKLISVLFCRQKKFFSDRNFERKKSFLLSKSQVYL